MIVIIPARGGSKGVPGKNIKNLNGKPLIQYTIDAARELVEDSKIIVSTDSIEIKKVVEQLGLRVPFLRPPELATDQAGTYEVLLHTLNWYEEKNATPEVIVLLQPTSPFRNGIHVKEAVSMYNSSLDMVVSVNKAKENPYYTLREENNQGYLEKFKESSLTRRQEVPEVWVLNGAVYVINSSVMKRKPLQHFRKVKKYVMDEISSLDIDTPIDWEIAKLFGENLEKFKNRFPKVD